MTDKKAFLQNFSEFELKNVTLKAAFFNSFFQNFYRNRFLSVIYHHKQLIINNGFFHFFSIFPGRKENSLFPSVFFRTGRQSYGLATLTHSVTVAKA